MSFATVPVEFGDPINAKILAVSEDRIQGFPRDCAERIIGGSKPGIG